MLGGGDSSRHSLTSSHPAMSASHHIPQTTQHTSSCICDEGVGAARMAPPPLVSPATGSDAASSQTHFIHADDSAGFFRDVAGRCLFLRGINLASSAKTPIGQPGHQLEGFWERAEGGELSFVNRVLDLDLDPADEHSADQHLRRLKSWGFNTLRYVTTWESIEHRGP